MYRHDPYTVHVIRLSENNDGVGTGCTRDKFLSPKLEELRGVEPRFSG